MGNKTSHDKKNIKIALKTIYLNKDILCDIDGKNITYCADPNKTIKEIIQFADELMYNISANIETAVQNGWR